MAIINIAATMNRTNLLSWYRESRIRSRAQRRELKYRRNLSRLCQIQSQPSAKPNGTVVTVILTTFQDPQRPAAKITNFAEYTLPWWRSVNAVGLCGVVLYDSLPEQFVRSASTPNIRFERIATGDWPLYHERHRLVRNFLLGQPDGWYCVTDVSDVAFRRNPFDEFERFQDGNRLFVGSERKRIGDCPFLIDEMTRQLGEVVHSEKRVLNPGILGGQRRQLCRLLDRLNDETQKHVSSIEGTDMSLFNKTIYDHYSVDQIVTGFPLHSEFKRWEFNTDAAIIHK